MQMFEIEQEQNWWDKRKRKRKWRIYWI